MGKVPTHNGLAQNPYGEVMTNAVNNRLAAVESLRKAAASWPEMFPRREVGRLTGGLYSPGYLANEDSRGMGPKGGVHIGRNKVYFRENFLEWLVERLSCGSGTQPGVRV